MTEIEMYNNQKNMILLSVKHLYVKLDELLFKLLSHSLARIDIVDYVKENMEYFNEYIELSDSTLEMDYMDNVVSTITFIKSLKDEVAILDACHSLQKYIRRNENNKEKNAKYTSSSFLEESFNFAKLLFNINSAFYEKINVLYDLKENVKTDLKSLYVNIDILEKAMFSVQKYAEKNNLLIDYEKFISNNDIKFLTYFINGINYIRNPYDEEAIIRVKNSVDEVIIEKKLVK